MPFVAALYRVQYWDKTNITWKVSIFPQHLDNATCMQVLWRGHEQVIGGKAFDSASETLHHTRHRLAVKTEAATGRPEHHNDHMWSVYNG